MRRFQNQFFCLILALCIPSFGLMATPKDPLSCNELACEAYQRRHGDANWLFSPFSASACLSMVYAGSNGQTALEIQDALNLHFPPAQAGRFFHQIWQELVHGPADDKDFKLHIVQGIWSQINFPFLESYMASMRTDFGAMIQSLKFSPQAANCINSWIASQTDQKIQNLLSPSDITPDTRLVLANALYFKGCWLKPFLARSTTDYPFSVQPGTAKQVHMMNQTGQFQYFEDSELQAVVLPFFKDASAKSCPACLLLLSKNPAVPLSLSTEKLDLILSSLQVMTVNLQVPKFKLEQGMGLNTLLMQLGMHAAFNKLADFSGMDGRGDLFLSKVLQKCFFSFEENGVEAAAATVAIMNMTSGLQPPRLTVSFIADHPFEFMLLDLNSKTCLMLGHVADPTE
jgi:serpin B